MPIDQSGDHLRLAEIVTRLEEAVREGSPRFVVQSALSDFTVCAELHLNSHSPQPETSFLESLTRLEIALARGEQDVSAPELTQVRAWLDDHTARSG